MTDLGPQRVQITPPSDEAELVIRLMQLEQQLPAMFNFAEAIYTSSLAHGLLLRQAIFGVVSDTAAPVAELTLLADRVFAHLDRMEAEAPHLKLRYARIRAVVDEILSDVTAALASRRRFRARRPIAK